MTQKELSYLEDAIGHEKNIVTIIEETINNLEDERLVAFMQKEESVHQDIKETLLNKLKEKANG